MSEKRRGRRWHLAVPALLILAVLLMLPVGGGEVTGGTRGPRVSGIDLSAYPSDPPREAISLVFLHHSCGGQLLADAGEEAGRDCIYESHPNGGGLRRRLKEAGYEVHEASYGSRIGARTDVFDWLPKFRGEMDAVLACE
ncbi:MAG: hypothetical protein ACYTDY_16595, partial [Planctomycetota bacterium]